MIFDSIICSLTIPHTGSQYISIVWHGRRFFAVLTIPLIMDEISIYEYIIASKINNNQYEALLSKIAKQI